MLDENKEEAEWYDVDAEKVVCTTPNDAVVDENKDEATWCDVDANASPTSSSSSNATPLCLLFIIVDHCIVRRVPHCLLYVDVTLPPLHSHGPSHEEEKEAKQYDANVNISLLCLLFVLVVDIRINIDKADYYIILADHHHNTHP
ncbi:hypothetical protein BHM03_00005844 [Ensete ventricosum]|nr:hypothetical protein BHM03_00005844 [Ensete ventricosum]